MGDDIAQLHAFYDHYAANPALVRYQGQPVLFFWQSSTFDNGTWSSIRSQLDPNHTSIWLADGDNFNILGGDAWDGVSPYAIAWSADPASHCRAGGMLRGTSRLTSCGIRLSRPVATTLPLAHLRVSRTAPVAPTTSPPGTVRWFPIRRGQSS